MPQTDYELEKTKSKCAVKPIQSFDSGGRVFKFRAGTSTDVESLRESYLWFENLNKQNDPFEGWAAINDTDITNSQRINFLKKFHNIETELNHITEQKVQELYLSYLKKGSNQFEHYVDGKARSILNTFFNEFRDETHICSFSKKISNDNHKFPFPLNSMMLWSHYANGFKGYCVEYGFDELMTSINQINDIDIVSHPVKYSQTGKLPLISLKTVLDDIINDTKMTSLDILKAFCTKEQTWFYENEIRLLSMKRGKIHYNSKCINAIYLSEKISDDLSEKIINIVKNFQSKPKIYKVIQHRFEYKLGLSEYTYE
jgi:hypothetical protein